jgi:hypothetical protein
LDRDIPSKSQSHLNLKDLMLLEFNLSRLKDKTLFFKIEAIVIRKKTIVIFIRLGFIKREKSTGTYYE